LAPVHPGTVVVVAGGGNVVLTLVVLVVVVAPDVDVAACLFDEHPARATAPTSAVVNMIHRADSPVRRWLKS